MPMRERDASTLPRPPAEAAALARAFIAFARWRAAAAALLIALGSVFDGLGLLFLAPVLDLVVGPRAAGPGAWRAPLSVFSAAIPLPGGW